MFFGLCILVAEPDQEAISKVKTLSSHRDKAN